MVLEKVREIKKDLPLMGMEKVNEEIKPFLYEYGIKMGKDKLYGLLRAYHLLPKSGSRAEGEKNLGLHNPGIVFTSILIKIQ